MGVKNFHKEFVGRDEHDMDDEGVPKHSLHDLGDGSVVLVDVMSPAAIRTRHCPGQVILLMCLTPSLPYPLLLLYLTSRKEKLELFSITAIS